jgi:hypothetical protein
LGVAAALLVLLAGVVVAACYDAPTPDCGFLCGPNGACPAGYICADDYYCHRIGAPADLVCNAPDAAMPGDAGDAPVDAMSDAPVDAMSDAPVDAMSDAPVDAM